MRQGPLKPFSLTCQSDDQLERPAGSCCTHSFQVPCTTCSTPPPPSQPLYNRTNKFFTSAPLSSLLADVPAGAERDELVGLWEQVRGEYGRISGVYQESKGDKGIPLA